MRLTPKIVIENIPEMGFSVFAKKNITKGTQIDAFCPFVKIDKDEKELILSTILSQYVFNSPFGDNGVLLLLGMGSLLNHSETDSNVEIRTMHDSESRRFVKIVATRKIQEGEQLFLDYGYNLTEEYETYIEKKKKTLIKL